MFPNPGSRVGRGESLPFLRKQWDRLLGRTRGMLLRRGSSGWEAYALGAANTILTSNGTDPAWSATATGTYRSVISSVSGSASTTLTLPGISADNYFCVVSAHGFHAGAGTNAISMYFNSDTTAGNYDVEQLLLDGATVTAARANSAVCLGIAPNASFSLFGIIGASKNSAGSYDHRAILFGNSAGDAAVRFHVASLRWRTQGTDVTQLIMSGSVASGLGVGTGLNCFMFAAPS